MGDKIQLNIVYAPQKREPHKVYENNLAEIWHSGKWNYKMTNIGMGWYSIRKPKSRDNILVIEPFCVLPKDYEVNFLKAFNYIFTWTPKAFNHPKLKNKIVEINHPSCLGIEKINPGKDWNDWKNRSDEIVFIANNKKSSHKSELYTLRVMLADYLHRNSKFKVSWYGQISLNKKYFKGPLKSKQELLTKVKFSICCENSYSEIYTHNYFTEKMPEVWKAGAVPIYMGCYNIDSFGFHPKSYIDLRKFVKPGIKQGSVKIRFQQLLSAIEQFSENDYITYSNIVKNKILTPKCLFHHISYERMYNQMIKTLTPTPPKR